MNKVIEMKEFKFRETQKRLKSMFFQMAVDPRLPEIARQVARMAIDSHIVIGEPIPFNRSKEIKE